MKTAFLADKILRSLLGLATNIFKLLAWHKSNTFKPECLASIY